MSIKKINSEVTFNSDENRYYIWIKENDAIDVLTFVRWRFGNPLYKSVNYLCDGMAVIFNDNVQWIGHTSALIIMSLNQYRLIKEYTLAHPIKQDFTEIQLIKTKPRQYFAGQSDLNQVKHLMETKKPC